jgi:hypothetical protein
MRPVANGRNLHHGCRGFGEDINIQNSGGVVQMTEWSPTGEKRISPAAAARECRTH